MTTTPLTDPENIELRDVDVVGDVFDDPAYRKLLGLPEPDAEAVTE